MNFLITMITLGLVQADDFKGNALFDSIWLVSIAFIVTIFFLVIGECVYHAILKLSKYVHKFDEMMEKN